MFDEMEMSDIDFDSEHTFEKTKCGRIIYKHIEALSNRNDINPDERGYLCSKVIDFHKKFNYMRFAAKEAKELMEEFITTQNMDCPALFGKTETLILFYIESMILFSRSALDISSTVFARFLFNCRLDSYNDLVKKIIKDKTGQFNRISELFVLLGNVEISAYRLLCSVDGKRGLRDQLAHQMTMKIEFCEYKENSEKEQPYIIVNKVSLEYFNFLNTFCKDAELMALCFEKFILSKDFV